MPTKKRSKKTKRSKRRSSATTRATSAIVKAFSPSKKLPAVSTLVKLPTRYLAAAVKRYKIALYSKGGRRVATAPRGPSTITPSELLEDTRRGGTSLGRPQRRNQPSKDITRLFPEIRVKKVTKYSD